MSEREHFMFEQKLAFHTAPTLLGIKCGGLLSLSEAEFDLPEHLAFFNRKAGAKGLKIRMLCSCGKRKLIFVYREKMLQKRLSEHRTERFLKSFGYHDFSVDKCISRLSERITTSSVFPHEIGIFLDYPVDDVIGFIKNKGENCKLCGYWKVYSNPEQAQRKFINYAKCRNFLCNKLNQGCDIYQALKII